jgi:hypothetical protein
MRRRPRVLACAVALAHLNISCVAHTTRPIVPMEVKPAEELEIIGAVKTSGERFQFPDDSPARVRNGALCATEAWSVQLHIVPRSQVQEPRKFGGRHPDRIVTTDGRTYTVSHFVSADDEQVSFETRVRQPRPIIEILKSDVAERSTRDGQVDRIRMKGGQEYRGVEVVGEDERTLRVTAHVQDVCTPLVEFQQLVIREVDAGATALRTIGGLLLTGGVLLAITIALYATGVLYWDQ